VTIGFDLIITITLDLDMAKKNLCCLEIDTNKYHLSPFVLVLFKLWFASLFEHDKISKLLLPSRVLIICALLMWNVPPSHITCHR